MTKDQEIDSPVRVRFAPSPTGHLHIGGVRTGLFNWLFARNRGGVFILRIEDTDRTRSTEESIEGIIEGMDWLGLKWDEGPFRQTDRFDHYRAEVDRLLREGKAYRCYCTAEELEARRAEAMKRGLTPKYDGRCRGRTGPVPGRSPAIRFLCPQEGQTVVEDLVKGTVVFENAQLDDLILIRSDGTPTYNLCVVVDDVDMKISHVIRGDDHLNNTPRQVQLYRALGHPVPRFAHVSMILGEDKTRLSKRHGATSTLAYREMGYLPEALLNYLARLGWSSGDQEIFSIQELIEKFDLNALGKSAAVFNPEKLLWLNGHYIHHGDSRTLAARLLPFIVGEGILSPDERPDEAVMLKMVGALKERSRTLVEMAQAARYFLRDDYPVDEAARAKFLVPGIGPALGDLVGRLEKLDSFSVPQIEKAFAALLEDRGMKLSKLAQPVRVALTGRTVSPGVYEVIEILGKEKTLARLKQALNPLSPPE
jgi:glutamyl-tRNA synthetase